MSLHGNPQCAASRMALHLEQTYGLQLDPYRHRQLVAELEEFTGRVDEPDSTDEPEPSDPAANEVVTAKDFRYFDIGFARIGDPAPIPELVPGQRVTVQKPGEEPFEATIASIEIGGKPDAA